MNSMKLSFLLTGILIIALLLVYLIFNQKQFFGNSGKILTPGFPELPVYPNAQIINSSKTMDAQGKSVYSASWSIPGSLSVDKVFSWVEDTYFPVFTVTEAANEDSENYHQVKLRKDITDVTITVSQKNPNDEITFSIEAIE